MANCLCKNCGKPTDCDELYCPRCLPEFLSNKDVTYNLMHGGLFSYPKRKDKEDKVASCH